VVGEELARVMLREVCEYVAEGLCGEWRVKALYMENNDQGRTVSRMLR